MAHFGCISSSEWAWVWFLFIKNYYIYVKIASETMYDMGFVNHITHFYFRPEPNRF